MKALTVKNPWAWLIAQGIKDIENRTWRTNLRGRVLIHAASGLAKGRYTEFLPSKYIWSLSGKERVKLICESAYTRSQILCSVEIIDCVQNHSSIWAEKGKTEDGKQIWNWVLAKPAFEPQYEGLKIKGALSFWEMTENRIVV